MDNRPADSHCCVISLGINTPSPRDHPAIVFQDFPRGLARLRQNLRLHEFGGEILTWDRDYPVGSPTATDAYCAFKPFCFADAQRRGHRLVLWLDSSIVVKRRLEPIFDAIARDGYVFYPEQHSVGEYCKDAALETLGITREESFRIPSCWACTLGLDLHNPVSVDFLRQWQTLASDGVTFPGPKWSGVRGWPRTASPDERVKGHRYDQTAASVIAMKLGMTRWRPRREWSEFFENDRRFVRELTESIAPDVLRK